MKTKQQRIISELIAQYSYINEEGERIAMPEYGSNYKIRVGSILTTLKRWSYFAAYGEFPENKLYTASRHKQSIEPGLLYSPADF
ncbi:hypothetical protein [Marinobacterium sediminicola]|uniref:Uncharacterized protein n=1 Tax=Marinobacterium sediminicola TaxID=518898 RepID=A0ABY1S3G1_9GAMM|nr:hypothetical protein [Marinobacterium sediminicola]ULG69290.1 hypothetical protein LN244_00310 [Marinobacterium sediminicola]SMR77640.1 hypothetical protein SAMN04487964_11558 [Marinobacterium sediminicola]